MQQALARSARRAPTRPPRARSAELSRAAREERRRSALRAGPARVPGGLPGSASPRCTTRCSDEYFEAHLGRRGVRYLIEHETRLAFPKPVREHQCELRLAPRDSDAQHAAALRDRACRPRRSCASTSTASATSCTASRCSRRTSGSPRALAAEVETPLANPFDYRAARARRGARLARAAQLREEPLAPRLRAAPQRRRSRARRPGCAATPPVPTDAAQRCSRTCRARWRGRARPSTTSRRDRGARAARARSSSARAGVCQDFAHLLVALVRVVGLPRALRDGLRRSGRRRRRRPRARRPTPGPRC